MALPKWASDSLIAMGVVSTVGGVIATAEEAKMESLLLKHNAIMAGYDAEYAELQADVAERNMRKNSSQISGAARVAAGSSGFASDSASSLDAIQDIDRNIELNAEAIRYGGRVRAGQLRDRQASLEAQARATSTLGRAKAATTLLSGARSLLPLVVN